jgi:sugar phosphate isomerase/epimerase
MTELKKYMSSIHMPTRGDWRHCITLAAETGFDGIELFGSDYDDETLMKPDLLRDLAALARQKNIILSAHPWMDWSSLSMPLMGTKFRQLLEYCAVMEIREINCHLAFFTDRNQGFDRLFSVVDNQIPFLCEHAMTLLFENVPAHGFRELGSEPADFDELFAHYSSDPIMLTIDNGHANIEKTMKSLSVRWGSRWRYTHINDNDGIEDRHWWPGAGSVDWRLVAECARKVAYCGPLMMEYSFDKLSRAMPVLTQAYADAGFSIAALSLT